MTQSIFHKTILLLIFSGIAALSFAQGSTVRASVDKNKILIGEPITLRIEVNIPQNGPIRFFSIDTFPHFEFLEKQKIDTSRTGNNTLLYQVIRITSFDSGHWVIPSFTLAKKIATDTIPIDVGFSDFDPNQDYHDIKDIIEVHPSGKRNWQWWYIVTGGLALLFLFVFFFRKKKTVKPIAEPLLNPYEEAMKQLEILKKEVISPKQYYSRLVDVFRLYIFRKKGILSLQKTTDDLILQLDNINLDKHQYAQLSQVLRLSDFVKFAKYLPSEEDSRNVFETIKNSIITIEKSEHGATSIEGN